MITETSGFTHRFTTTRPRWFASERGLTEEASDELRVRERPIDFAADARR